METVPTGIGELDRILGGGFPRGSTTLFTGGPGTGKTILSAQFILNGAVRLSEKGVFVTFNESSNALNQYMLTLGWDFAKLQMDGKIRILDFAPVVKDGLDRSLDVIFEETTTLGAKRLVLDSASALFLTSRERPEARTTVAMIQQLLRKLDCTSILVSEIPWGKKSLGSCIEQFVVDGIILLETLPAGAELKRRLAILKMRGMNHDMKFYQYSIAREQGFVITPYPEVV